MDFTLKGLHGTVIGTEEMSGPEGYRITRIEANVTVETIEDERDAAEACVELTREYCPLTRTLEKAIDINIASQILIVP